MFMGIITMPASGSWFGGEKRYNAGMIQVA
jgi:hypothetical protein